MDVQTNLETVAGASEHTDALILMSSEPSVPRDFLLKQIENEINAGFVLVEAARRAYKRRQAAEGDGALGKAVETHRQIWQQVSQSPAVQVRAITHQLTELRNAIDWLIETVVSSEK